MGQRVRLAGSELVWRKVRLEDYEIDFNLLVGEKTNWAVAYAVCYIQSETEQTGLVIHVGSDDQSKVYLNREEIYDRNDTGTYVADHDEVAGASLKAGLNVLVFKVINGDGGWQGSIRFSDRDGNPVKGITVTLDLVATESL